jgi:signal transduction histidine kinase/ligand-binding sensor domain-containing protein
MRFKTILLATHIFFGFCLSAQIPFIKCQHYTFNTNDNLNSNTVTSINIDAIDQIWVAANGRIQYFNGQKFDDPINTKHCLELYNPYVKNANFFQSDSIINVLDIHKRSSKKISPKDFANNSFSTIILYDIPNKENIYDLKGNKINIDFTDTRLKYANKNMHKNSIYTIVNSRLHIFDLKNKTIRIVALKCDAISDNSEIDIYDDKLFFISKSLQLNVVDLKNEAVERTSIFIKNELDLIKVNACKDNFGNIVLSINSHVYVMKPDLSSLIELKNLDNETFTSSGKITDIAVDKFNNIYIATLFEGLIKIIYANTAIKYYGSNKSGKTFVKSLAIEKDKNRIVIGTWGHGVQVYDTLNKLRANSQNEHFIATHLVRLNENKYIATSFRDSFLYLINFYSQFEFNIVKTNFVLKGDNFLTDEFIINDYETLLALTSHIVKITKYPKLKIEELPLYGQCFSVEYVGNKMIQGGIGVIRIHNQTNGELISVHNFEIGNVRCLEVIDGHSCYAGTDSGLYIFDLDNKKCTKVSNEIKAVFALKRDLEHNLWVSTDKGIYKISDQNKFERYTKYDGLQDWEFNNNAAVITKNGALFFGGVNGLNSFYPSQIKPSEIPIIFIDAVSTKGLEFNYKIPNKSILEFPYSKNAIKIEFGILGNFLPSQYKIQYYIEGLTNQWIDIGQTTSLVQVFPQGKHKIYFHSSLEYNPSASLVNYISIKVQTPFYLAAWFWIAALFAISFAIYYLVSKYKNLQFLKSAAQWEAKETLMKERNRLSKELHDFIGAQLSIISRNIDWIISNKTVISDEDLNKKLNQISAMSSKTNTDIRDTIWATKKEILTIDDLISRLKSFAFNVINDNFIIAFENSSSNFVLSSIEAINLLRICQEAINNALKYSKAKEITISTSTLEGAFSIAIEDKGIGFDFESEENAGNGLANMKERAEEINYSIVFVTSLGYGCKIILRQNAK